MKQIVFIGILSLMLIGCKESIKSKDSKPSQGKEIVTEVVKPQTKHHQKMYRHNLSLYNEKYVLEISPSVDELNRLNPIINLYQIDCCITEERDTIFYKKVSLENLVEKTRAVDVKLDNISVESLFSDYVLDKIVYHNVRADRLYFEATYLSKLDQLPIKTVFNFRYRNTQNNAELKVNQVSHRGWGRNKGDEDGFNQIELSNPEECGMADSQYSQEKAIKERKELLLKIQEELSGMNVQNWTYELWKDSLIVTEKISFKGKTEYNILKIPMHKLANTTTSGSQITVYTQYKDIPVDRFGYKPLNTSQVEITPDDVKSEYIELRANFKRLSQINCYLKTL